LNNKELDTVQGNLANVLRGHGIGPTHQRIEIAHALFSRCAHLSADQILAIVNERNAETSKATVYNTLNLFLEKKLIREVIVDPRKVFYDPTTTPHHHF
jgi:Fur family transcriptional regulator, iron response regulator